MRTIVYDEPDVQFHYADVVNENEAAGTPPRKGPDLKRRRVRKEAESRARQKKKPSTKPADVDAGKQDDYLSRIAKYVPAEMITLTTLGFAAIEPTGNSVWFLIAGGALLNMLYLFSLTLGKPLTTPRPRSYFYLLSAVAFLLWSMATIDLVQKKAGISGDDVEIEKTFVLALAAFIVPALDVVFSKIDLSIRKD